MTRAIAAHIGHSDKRSDRRMLHIRLFVTLPRWFWPPSPAQPLRLRCIAPALVWLAPRCSRAVSPASDARCPEVRTKRSTWCRWQPTRGALYGLPLIRERPPQPGCPSSPPPRSGTVSCRLRRTEINVEPSVAGRTMRACSIPGSVTSQLHCVLPVTLSGMPGIGIRRANHLVLAHRLHRRVSRHHQSIHACPVEPVMLSRPRSNLRGLTRRPESSDRAADPAQAVRS